MEKRMNINEYEYPQISNVGAGFARPDTSTDMFMGALGQANPAPTSKLAKCGHSFIFFVFLGLSDCFLWSKRFVP